MKLADFLESSCQVSEVVMLNCAIVIKCNSVYLFDYVLNYNILPCDNDLFCIDEFINAKSIERYVPLLGGGEISYIGSFSIKLKKDLSNFGEILILTTSYFNIVYDIYLGENLRVPEFMMELKDLNDGFISLSGVLYLEDGVCYLTDKEFSKKYPIIIDNIQSIIENNCEATEEWPIYKLYVSIVAKFSSSKDYIEDIKSWSFYYGNTCVESFNGIGRCY